MKICMTLVLSISFANVICAQSLEEKSSAALFRDVFDFLEQKHDLGELNDLEDDEIIDGVLQLFRKHEFDESDLMADGFLSGIWNMLGSRNGKSTFQFYNLARQLGCYQGKSRGLIRTIRFAYTNYNEYGCYCGGGKSYGNPLDDTDRCCQIHDVCYEKAMKKYKLSEGCQTYTTQYKTKCYMRRKTTECGNESPSAGRALCDCDQAMAICVSRPKALKTYRTSLKNVRRSAKCYVPGKTTSTSKNIWKLIKTCKNIGRKRSARRRRRRGFLWGK